MAKGFVLFCLFSLVLNNDWVVSVGGVTFYENDFYSYYSQDVWDHTTAVEKRGQILDGFIIKKGVYLDAVDMGLYNDPVIIKRLLQRQNMLLVNEYYYNYFLKTLVPESVFLRSKINLKKEVFVNHILIGYDGVNLPGVNLMNQPDAWILSQNIVDTLRRFGRAGFNQLALRHSQDPSVKSNFGSLGWVGWGQMLPKFQDVAFSLDVGTIGVANTEYGYHIIVVDSVRASVYNEMQKNEYNDLAFRFSTAYIKDSLAYKAQSHDSLLFRLGGVVFNNVVLGGFLDVCNALLVGGNSRREVDVVSILNDYVGVFAIYNNDLLGGAWFANKLSKGSHKNPFYNTITELQHAFSTLIIQDIVKNLSIKKGLDNSYSYLKQYNSIKEAVLYKARLNRLVLGCEAPDSVAVARYYVLHKDKKYADVKKGGYIDLSVVSPSIEALLLKEKQEKLKDEYLNAFLNNESTGINNRWLNDFK